MEMKFLSFVFILFMILLMLLLFMIKQEERRQNVLLAASYLFYTYADYRFSIFLLLQTLIAYFSARIIDSREKAGKASRIALILGLIFSIGILAVLKYTSFAVSVFLKDWGGVKREFILPLGISFYTFQAISYIADIYQKKLPVEKSFKKVALYIGFFPQITSGPIVKAHDFFKQLEEGHPVKIQNIIEGIQIFLMGLVKKIVIADRLGRAVDAVYAAPGVYSGISVFLATIAYSIQIYCDFSGYSDMAIGVARSLGYDLGKNFNVPYIAHNPSEFWQRWHISLSSWFREYVYFPLGGSRKGLGRTCWNLFFVMLLSGLWHGAGWTFILWGIYHGIGSIIHKIFIEIVNKNGWDTKSSTGKRIFRIFSIFLTFLFVNFGWVLFRSDSIETVGIILYRIFTLADGVNYIYVFTIIFAVFFMIVNSYVLIKRNGEAFYIFLDYNKFSSWFILWTVIFLTLMFFYPGESAFIYGQF